MTTPSRQGSPEERTGTTKPQRKRPRPGVLIGLAAGFAFAVLFGLYIAPLFIRHPHDPHEDTVLLPPVEYLITENATYYVFESLTINGDTITDPNYLYLDNQGSVEDWYYLSIALTDQGFGKLCTNGHVVEFTYEPNGDAFTLHVPLNAGYDGAELTVGDDTLTLEDAETHSITVLRRVDEPPTPAG